jgi:hypothetical protein
LLVPLVAVPHDGLIPVKITGRRLQGRLTLPAQGDLCHSRCGFVVGNRARHDHVRN